MRGVCRATATALIVALVSVGAATASWIPIVTHTQGVGGSQWRSEVRILNVTQGPAAVMMRLHTATETLQYSVVIQPGGSINSPDVVSLFRPGNASGCIEVTSDRGVLATSRTYDARYPSEFGQVLDTVEGGAGFADGDLAYIQQLREGGGARTNIAALNTGDERGTVKVELLDPIGVLVGELSLVVDPGQVVQSNRPFSRFGRTNIVGGFARVTIKGGHHVHVFASVVEGATGDADTIWAKKAPADTTPGLPLLDPTVVPQFAQPLVIPPAMPPTRVDGGVAEYEIAAREFSQQVLPPGFPSTRVWGYGRAGDPLPGSGQPTTFNYPAFTVEARVNQAIRVKWVNGLTDSQGRFLRHLLPVDQTLHWANPPGPPDSEGTTVGPYLGPIPLTTHLHGGHVAPESDGHPESWFLPDATDIPTGFSKHGTHYATAQSTGAGSAFFDYPNDQRATTMWYHDHALGMTRLNVYAGLAGFWLLRDAAEDALGLPGPAPHLGDPAGTRYYEIPIAIQDRMFQADGSLFYPDRRAFFDGYDGPTVPDTEVPPVWNPEVFGNVMVVNGKAWPLLEVEPRLYRLRVLNGCNARTLILTLSREGMVFHRIGNEGGLLPGAPVTQAKMLLAPAERADVIVDFSGLQVGDEVTLLNLGPDEPFKGLNRPEPQEPAAPATTGRVMKFKVVAPTGQGAAGSIPASLPAVAPLQTALPPRDLTLNEMKEDVGGEFGEIPVRALLGTAEAGPLMWGDPTTEKPHLGDTEVWRIANLTEDAHPMHLHLVDFQVLDRTPFNAEAYSEAQRKYLAGQGVKPEIAAFVTGPSESPRPEEAGFKETVITDPGYVTRLIAKFDKLGVYVWHCHIVEHEDNEMMRQFEVVPK